MEQGFGKAVFVVGPTASGKTALAHQIATQLHAAHQQPCTLVNMDAYQFYRGVDIGSAKPSRDEILKYDYRGIDFLDPLDAMDAARYAEFVWSTCRSIGAAGRLPICVGGSGLYLRSVLHGLDELPARHDGLREMFRASAVAWGWPLLHDWLNALAPERARQLHPNDKTRIERALEIVLQLPEGVSPAQVFRDPEPLHQQKVLGDCYVIRVDCADEILKSRIADRLDAMFLQGWVQEVKALKHSFGPNFLTSQAGKAIGYRDIFVALEDWGEHQSLWTAQQIADLKSRIATLTWQYVRRQRTWNAQERVDWEYDASLGIAEKQFPASFLSFL